MLRPADQSLVLALSLLFLTQLLPEARSQGPFGSRGPGGSGGPPMGGPGDFIRRMDSNGNGVLEANELSDRARSFIERAARDAGLDPSRPIPINRLEESMRQRFSGGGDRGSSDRGGSSWGGDRGGDRSSASSGATSSSAPIASAAPPIAVGVQGFGVPTVVALVPGFGAGAAGIGVDPGDLKDAQDRMDDADRNRDGLIDQDEARREDVSSDFWAYDRNADGKLSLEEVAARYQARRVARMTAKVEQRDLDEARETIRRYDKNNDGMLDDEEMRDSRYADEYRRYDVNRDGRISQQEMAQRYAGRRVNSAPVPTGRPGAPSAMASLSSRTPTNSSPPSSSSSSSRSSSSGGSSGSSGDADQRARSMVDERMNEVDKNKDGYIDKQEFDAGRSRFRSEMKEYDSNGDGRIAKDELLKRYQSFMSGGGFGGGGPFGGGMGGGQFGGGSSFGGGGSFGSRDGSSRDGGSRDGGSRSGSRDSSRSASSAPTKKSYRFLTPTERLDDNLPDWFKEKDKNGDGQIAMTEFAGKWSDKEATEFLRADLNGDGMITAKECLLGPAVSAPPSGPFAEPASANNARAAGSSASSSSTLASAVGTVDERIRNYAEKKIKEYDKNGDGTLDVEEFKSYTRPPENADKDGDGKVNVDELAAALSKK